MTKGQNAKPKHWEESRLQNVGLTINGDRGKNYPSRAHYVNSGVPFISAGNIECNFIDATSLNYITNKKYETLNNGKLKKDDIIYCLRGSLGKCAIFNLEKGAISSSLCILRLNGDMEAKFVYYYLCGPMGRAEILKHDNGTAQPNLSAKNFASFIIVKPTFSEQQAIVSKIEELFSELDKGVENLRLAQQQLKTYRQAVLKWAFEGKLTGGGNKENGLPTSWKVINLGEVIEKPRYGTSKKCHYEIKGKGVLRIPNIANGVIDSSDLKFSIFTSDEIEAYRLKEGDILTIRSNGSVDLVGKCALVTKKDETFLYAGYLIRLRPIQNSIQPKFLLYIFSSVNMRSQIEGKAKSTSGVNNINSEELGSLLIPLPPVEEQGQILEAIESRLSVADKLEETITQGLRQADVLRQSILKMAFEGKLV